MVRTPEKLTELYIQWKSYSVPEWGRSCGLNISGITTQDKAERVKTSKEGMQIVEELRHVLVSNDMSPANISVRLCIDDGVATCRMLESSEMETRELIHLISPDPDENPWEENERWLLAAQALPRALTRIQSSGPWIKDVFCAVIKELKEAQLSNDPLRSKAAMKARELCEHMIEHVGILKQNTHSVADERNAKILRISRSLVKRDKAKLGLALRNMLRKPHENAITLYINEMILDDGRVLGAAEIWRNSLRAAIERTGWANIPAGKDVVFQLMPESRSYSKASLRNVHTQPTVQLLSPTANILFPMTIAHETYPGHFLQKLHQLEAPTSAMKFLGSSMSEEGWAHYAEMKMKELDLSDSDRHDIGLAQCSLVRSLRCYTRCKTLLGELSEDGAAHMFKSVALLDDASARREARRVQWDNSSCHYALGRLALEQMEDEFVERGMGDAAKFRNLALPVMCAPLDIIAKKLNVSRPTYI
jgi:hypothetical protein